MKKLLFLALLALLTFAGCATTGGSSKSSDIMGAEQILPYVHIDGFGTETDTPAWIAWEFEALGYVKYQIAYISCTCRPDSINARSLLHVEVTKDERGGKIRKLYFDYWGDSQTMPSGITRQQLETGFMPSMIALRASGVDELDTVSGATVTTINLKQILAYLLKYHNAKYPGIGENDDGDVVDATSGATGESY